MSIKSCLEHCKKQAIAFGESKMIWKVPDIHSGLHSADAVPKAIYVERISKQVRNACGNGTWADGTPIFFSVNDTGLDKTHANGALSKIDKPPVTFTPDGPWDANSHGTWCMGSINGVGGQFFEGLCKKAKGFSLKCLDNNGSGAVSWIAASIRYAVEDLKVSFISLSLGGSFSRTIEAELQNAFEKGVIVLASIGNNGFRGDGHPGNSKFTDGVGAINFNKDPAEFTSRSQMVFITNYGVQTVSTVANGRYAKFSGTSMSCPITCGEYMLAAGLFDRLKGHRPSLGELHEFIRPYLEDLGQPGFDSTHGNGKLDLPGLVAANPLKPTDPVDPVDPVDPDPSLIAADILARIPGEDGKKFALVELK